MCDPFVFFEDSYAYFFVLSFLCDIHCGVLVTKVGYFGVKSAKVPRGAGADGHLTR